MDFRKKESHSHFGQEFFRAISFQCIYIYTRVSITKCLYIYIHKAGFIL